MTEPEKPDPLLKRVLIVMAALELVVIVAVVAYKFTR